VRNARELGFESRILGRHVARTCALESLIICSFLRGLSVRDVEAAPEATFDGPVIGKSTVARVCQDRRERYRRWCERRLDEHDLVYLFCDALHLKLRPDDEPAEGVLVAWGVTLEDRKVLLGLALGSRESYENRLAFGRDLVDRGLRAPALIVADGAPGLWKAARELWPTAEEQRCTVHALRNVTSKPPERHHRELKAPWWQVFDDAASVADARAACRRSSPTTGPPTHRRWPSSPTPRRDRRASAPAVRAPQPDPQHEPARVHLRRGQTAHQGDRPLPRRDQRPEPDLGRARALQPRPARRRDDPTQRRRDQTPPPPPANHEHRGGGRRLASTPRRILLSVLTGTMASGAVRKSLG
jgi:hypothetical protein